MPQPLVKDPSNPAHVKFGKDKERFLAAREASDMRALLALPQGRRFLWKWLSRFGTFQDTFHEEPIEMARRCGRRKAGLMLYEALEATDPMAYIKLYEESVLDQAPVTYEEEKKEEEDGISND